MTDEKKSTIFDFDPSKMEPTPEEKIARLMADMPDTVNVREPEYEPIKEEYRPADIMEIVKVMTSGGYKDLDQANRALRIMFTQSTDMLQNFQRSHAIISESEDRRRLLTKQRDESDTQAQGVGLAMRELCNLILSDDATADDVTEAARRCAAIAEAATVKVGEYEGNMLSIAINLRALADKKGPLKGLGSAARERILYLTNAAAAVLDDARVNMLSLREAAQGLVQETTMLRAQMETVNAQADKPEVLN